VLLLFGLTRTGVNPLHSLITPPLFTLSSHLPYSHLPSSRTHSQLPCSGSGLTRSAYSTCRFATSIPSTDMAFADSGGGLTLSRCLGGGSRCRDPGSRPRRRPAEQLDMNRIPYILILVLRIHRSLTLMATTVIGACTGGRFGPSLPAPAPDAVFLYSYHRVNPFADSYCNGRHRRVYWRSFWTIAI